MAGYGFNTGLDGHRIQPLTEREAEEVANGLVLIYGRARERMLTSVASRVSRGVHRYGWAERKTNEVLAAHEQLRRDLERAGRERESLLSGVMDRAYMTGSQQFMTEMRSMLGATAHISPNGMKAGYILADLNNSLNAAERRILRQFDDAYANIIGAVSSEMATGVMNTRQAVGDALQGFADKGITGFIDRGGHHWTLENYAEMAVLTAIERATISGYVDTMQSYGYDLAYIDGHIGSCPICEAWEGVIISVSGEDSRYPSLSDAENAGCFHPRCMHGISTYYDGISHAPKDGFRDEPRPVRAASPQYTARSRQRYMERQIRKYKDRAIVAQTPQQKMQAMNKVREWENALDSMIVQQPADNYLYRHGERETPSTGVRMRARGDTGDKAIPYSQRGIAISDRHSDMLARLTRAGDCITGRSGTFSASDLALLSHETGVEYTIFTIGDTSYLLRGEETETSIPGDLSYLLQQQHGTIDAHSHPFIGDLVPSQADKDMMRSLPWQEKSVIVEPTGKAAVFTEEGTIGTHQSEQQHDPSVYERLWGDGDAE